MGWGRLVLPSASDSTGKRSRSSGEEQPGREPAHWRQGRGRSHRRTADRQEEERRREDTCRRGPRRHQGYRTDREAAGRVCPARSSHRAVSDREEAGEAAGRDAREAADTWAGEPGSRWRSAATGRRSQWPSGRGEDIPWRRVEGSRAGSPGWRGGSRGRSWEAGLAAGTACVGRRRRPVEEGIAIPPWGPARGGDHFHLDRLP